MELRDLFHFYTRLTSVFGHWQVNLPTICT
jgi:hypothetical protein